MANLWAPFIESDEVGGDTTISSSSDTSLGVSVDITPKIDTRVAVLWFATVYVTVARSTTGTFDSVLAVGVKENGVDLGKSVAAGTNELGFLVTLQGHVVRDLTAGVAYSYSMSARLVSIVGGGEWKVASPRMAVIALPGDGVGY